MKRTRSESKLIDKAILDLFAEFPESKLVEHKYKTLRKLIGDRYSILRDIDKEVMYKIIFDIVTLDRRVRLFTQDEQKELKKQLSDEYVVNEIL